MKKIPIAFCFDDNLEMPAGVCMTSLLTNAKTDTFYDIFILHAAGCRFPQGRLNELPQRYPNCQITYRVVGHDFENYFEIRGITFAAYYRLIIPELIPEYDKILYSDIDVIFQCDLADIYESADLSTYYMAGVSSPLELFRVHLKDKANCQVEQYIYSGNLIINSQKIREDRLMVQFRELAKQDWLYQDMDVLNIACHGKILYLPPWFCYCYDIAHIMADEKQSYYTQEEVSTAIKQGIVHYNGAKPWQKYCLYFDVWWMYYKHSIFYNRHDYCEFFERKMNDYDSLPLWKRVKILFRFFKNGRIKYRGNWYEL
jgi:lipopolysaccharide biosynthesis glycosyltransferase